MRIVEASTEKPIPVEIYPVEKSELKLFSKKRYSFDWSSESKFEVYKLVISRTEDALGLISMDRIPQEWRIHIRLIAVSKENLGSGKIYENIAGVLIAYASKIALEDFGEHACISLKPKTQIAKLYMEKYNMKITGMLLSLEVPELLNLINRYDYD